MLEIVSKGFQSAKAALTGRTTLTEANIDDALRAIRISLLEGDVELGVVRTFLERVKQRALGEVVSLDIKKRGKKLAAQPGDHFVLICHNELEKLMGPVEEAPIAFRRPLTTIMMVGLQGTGKTTTCGKLAHKLLAERRRPLLVAADIYRPAAVAQLKVLGDSLGVPVFAREGVAPAELCVQALREARATKRDVVIFDTAGRLAIDEKLMGELDSIKRQTRPDNIFLVCDAMAGQDTVRTASAFNRRLDITGFILTKLDGDARGGAALSIKEITGKPIKFLGMGEGLDKLESFRPEGLASRILGMGDIVGLMKDFEQVVDEKQAERDTKKLLKGTFTLEDFLSQLRTLKKMGSVKDIFDKLPMFGGAGAPSGAQIDDKAFVSMESMIQSMTPAERQTPSTIHSGRLRRIARGCGRKEEDVQALLQRFSMMQQMMANLQAQPGLLNSLPGMGQLAPGRKMKGRGMPGLLGGGRGLRLPGSAGHPAGSSGPMMGLGPAATDALPPGMPPLPPGVSPQQAMAAMQAQQAGMVPAAGRSLSSPKLRQKCKDKRKAEKKARKKSRR
jgi:signal recognition particle subunit SRP54